tara:strand:- start:82 stop:426 length:345 start_codon:yes stop_codon:yes gene_type:complete
MRQLNNNKFDTKEGASASLSEIVSSQFAPSVSQKDENKMQLHELLPRPIKKVKKQKSTRLSKLQKRAENVDLTLYGKIDGYYEIVEDNEFGYTGSLYKTLNECQWHIERFEGGK